MFVFDRRRRRRGNLFAEASFIKAEGDLRFSLGERVAH